MLDKVEGKKWKNVREKFSKFSNFLIENIIPVLVKIQGYIKTSTFFKAVIFLPVDEREKHLTI